MRKNFKVRARAADRPEENQVTPDQHAEATTPSAAKKQPAAKPVAYGKGGVFRSLGGGKRVRV